MAQMMITVINFIMISTNTSPLSEAAEGMLAFEAESLFCLASSVVCRLSVVCLSVDARWEILCIILTI